MKKIISTDKAPKAVGPYSQAIVKNNMIFLSGQIPINPATGKIIDGGIKEQTKQVLINIENTLNEANFNLDDIVKTTVYITDLSNFKDMNEIYATFFTNNPPARSTVQVSALPLNAMIEIEVIAIK
jgi:2-iminobutanoate/2-iminopropanoate deaminase